MNVAPRRVAESVQQKVQTTVDSFPDLKVYRSSWLGDMMFVHMADSNGKHTVTITLHGDDAVSVEETGEYIRYV